MNLRTAADIKRAMKTATSIVMIDHAGGSDLPWNSPSGKVPIGESRKIVKRQASAWGMAFVNRSGEDGVSWLYINRASDVSGNGDDTFTTEYGATYRIEG